jgi:hypothetical protein
VSPLDDVNGVRRQKWPLGSTCALQAHILVCFLAFVLWKSLEMWQSRAGLGNSPRIILEELKRIQSRRSANRNAWPDSPALRDPARPGTGRSPQSSRNRPAKANAPRRATLASSRTQRLIFTRHQKCSANFLAKALICLQGGSDSAQVGLGCPDAWAFGSIDGQLHVRRPRRQKNRLEAVPVGRRLFSGCHGCGLRMNGRFAAKSGHSITDKLFGISLSVDDCIAFVTLLVFTT